MRRSAAQHLRLPPTTGVRSADLSDVLQPPASDRAVEARARVVMGTAAVTALVACWWMFVVLPIPVTSLLPLLLLPLVGALSVTRAARCYADSNIFLFMGGFIIALAIERWGLHRRLALHTIVFIGAGRRSVVLSFMVASAMISMWVSNTATTMMLLPIGLAVISSIEQPREPGSAGRRSTFAAALMLGIAYGASIGGIGTPIGTPPNIVFRGLYHTLFPGSVEVTFLQWVLMWLPVIAVFLPVAWLVLTRWTCPVPAGTGVDARRLLKQELRELGPIRGPEMTVLLIFVCAAVLWMTRSLPIGTQGDYGWAALLARWFAQVDGAPPRIRVDAVNDATIAIGMAVLLFLIPAGRMPNGSRGALMDWETARRLPWDILLLFGGGFAIAEAFEETGLSHWCGQTLSTLGISAPLALVIATCLLVTFLTELTSNTATAQVMLPIMANLGQAAGIHPLLLMLPATVSASLGFMLPVGTPPNAIVFASGHIELKQMIRTGLILNLIGVVLVTAAMFLIAKPLLDLG